MDVKKYEGKIVSQINTSSDDIGYTCFIIEFSDGTTITVQYASSGYHENNEISIEEGPQ